MPIGIKEDTGSLPKLSVGKHTTRGACGLLLIEKQPWKSVCLMSGLGYNTKSVRWRLHNNLKLHYFTSKNAGNAPFPQKQKAVNTGWTVVTRKLSSCTFALVDTRKPQWRSSFLLCSQTGHILPKVHLQRNHTQSSCRAGESSGSATGHNLTNCLGSKAVTPDTQFSKALRIQTFV